MRISDWSSDVCSSDLPLLFDRGLPDVIGYARLFGAPAEAATAAARRYRYNRTAFLAPALPEIYCRDDERTMSFEAARDFGEMIRGGYKTLGYEIVELPRAAPGARAGFMLARIDRKSTRLNSRPSCAYRLPSYA